MRHDIVRIFAAVAVVVAAGGLMRSEAFADGPAVVGGRAVILKVYSVPAGNANEIAKVLQDQLGPAARIAAAGNNTIIVWASPEDQVRIDPRACAPREKVIKAESIDAGGHNPADLVQRLRALLDGKSSNLAIEPDPDNNAVIVRGPAELVAEAKAVIPLLRPVAGARH